MNKYSIYFEVYGKKLKTVVFASSEKEAKQIVLDKIIFHKIVKEKNDKGFDQMTDAFDSIMSILNLKKKT